MRSEAKRTLDAVIAANIRRLRQGNRWTQDQLAAQLRAAGLDMSRSAVAALERGGRALTVAEFVLVQVALRVSLDDLLAGDDEDVELSATAHGPLSAVRDVASGRRESAFFAIDRPEVRQAREPSARWGQRPRKTDVRARLWPDATFTEMEIAEASGRSEAEMRIARDLGVDPGTLGVAAFGLWGRSLTDERERRAVERIDPAASERSARTVRGHVTHELVGELRARLEEVR